MPDCDYCGASFDSESARDDHLRAEHADELGPIDQRRLGETEDDDDGIEAAPIALGVVLVAAVGIVAYVLFFAGGGGGGSGPPYGVNGYDVQQTPTSQAGSVHYHGTILMTVNGNAVDFSQREYQLQADAFHFENGDGERWHGHARGVTLEYAMATLGIGVTDDSVTFQGTTYNQTGGTNVTVAVNGENVAPPGYVLQEGDRVRIAVTES
ncbi:hypothetical protein [Halorarius halobius]|uniref:hypothetical protein n=1 Tax=Halorarius halobius TaxID=2962671 RepID=UPI0020CFAD8E|nr:hypothetical protein [Halorarius halobius]